MKNKDQFFNIRSNELQVLLYDRFEFGDKSYNLQALNCTKEQMEQIKTTVLTQHKDSKPFIQGQSENWIMVEFWHSNVQAIEQACQAIIKILGVTPEQVAGWAHPDYPMIENF